METAKASTAIEIRAYCDELVEAHKEFSSRMWKGKIRRRDEVYNRWKFRGPLSGNVDGLLVALSGGKVVGQLGLIPVKVRFKGNTKDSQWACDLMVDPEYRRSGIGNMLFEHAFKRDVMTIGNNPSPNAEALMLKAGFRKISSGRLMVFPLDAAHILKWIVPAKLHFATPALASLLQVFFSYKASKLKSDEVVFCDCSLEKVAGLLERCGSESQDAGVLHDLDFLKWRAAGFRQYSPEYERSCSEAGSFALHGAFGDSYNVYDWHCTTEKEARELICRLLVLSKKADCTIIQLVANSSAETEWLSSLGFIKARHEENIIHYSGDGFMNNARRFRFSLYDTDLNL